MKKTDITKIHSLTAVPQDQTANDGLQLHKAKYKQKHQRGNCLQLVLISCHTCCQSQLIRGAGAGYLDHRGRLMVSACSLMSLASRCKLSVAETGTVTAHTRSV